MKEDVAAVRIFYDALTDEKATFDTSLRQVLASEILITENVSGKVIGIAGVSSEALFVVVKQKFQGKGIGTHLIQKVIAECEHKGYDKISLSVRYTNKKAIRLYQKLGFKKIRCSPERGWVTMILPLRWKGVLVMVMGKISSLLSGKNDAVWDQFCILWKRVRSK